MPSVKKPKRKLQPHFLKEWRVSAGFTQEEAAPHLGLSRSQLSKIENGKVGYNQALLEAASGVYDCSVGELTMRNPTDKSAPWSVLDDLQRATKAQRELVISIVSTVLKNNT